MPTSHALAALALSPTTTLPAAGLRHLAASRDLRVRSFLARRTDLDQTTQRALADDRMPQVRLHALRNLDADAVEDVLTSDLAETATTQAGLALNPNTPADVLADYSTGPVDVPGSLMRLALMNPSTPTDAVRARLTRADETKIAGIASDADRSLIAARILRAHPTLAGDWAGSRTSQVHRILARRPDITVAEARTFRGNRGRRALIMNPYLPDGIFRESDRGGQRYTMRRLLDGQDPRDVCADPTKQAAAIAVGSPTLDLLVLEAGTTPEVLEKLWKRKSPCVEADVVAAAIGRSLDLAKAAYAQLSVTRMKAIESMCPTAAVVIASWKTIETFPTDAEVAETVDALGENDDAWRVFVRLALQSDGRLPDLATVALGSC